MLKPPAPTMTLRLANDCRKLVYRMAKKYRVPPAYITAHIRSRAADKARIEVWQIMIRDMHLRRWQVAKIFRRDVRRLRKSVIGV